MTGEIVNREGCGNRTNSMTFGPGKVILVVGRNKIVPDLDSAIARYRRNSRPHQSDEFKPKDPLRESGSLHGLRFSGKNMSDHEHYSSSTDVHENHGCYTRRRTRVLGMKITATAPNRVDLAGGTTDIHPLCLLMEGGLYGQRGCKRSQPSHHQDSR